MCCCCTKRIGHLVVVWFSLFSYTSSIMRSLPSLNSTSDVPPYASMLGLLLCIIGGCLCVLDINGIKKNNPSKMMPFLVWVVLSTIFAGIAAVFFTVTLIISLDSSDSDDVELMVVTASLALCCILNGYFSYVISAHKKEVEAQQETEEDKIEIMVSC